MGNNGRQYAENKYDIKSLCVRMELLLNDAILEKNCVK